MLILGKLFTWLILPPGGIVLFALAAGFLALRRRNHLIAILACASGLLLYGLSIRPVADMLLAPLESTALMAPEMTDSPSHIVVLGGGSFPARYARDDRLGKASTARITTGFILHRETGLPMVLSGGAPLRRDGVPEARVAAELLAGLGVAETALLVEPESRNTWENAARTAALIDSDQVGETTVYLVTSASHLRRAIECFHAFGIIAIPVGADFRAWERSYSFWEFLPHAGTLEDSALALHEYVGRLFYRVRYGRAGYRLGL